MIGNLLIGAGVALCSLDRVVSVALGRLPRARMEEKLDKTGRVTKAPQPLIVKKYDPDVCLIHYPGNYSHSLWRSQELSLLARHKELLSRPRLDFGCGDGSFASMLFDRVDCGVDNDREALRVADQYRIYDRLACSDGASLPIKPKSIRSIFSNSVLEHVENIEETVSGLREVLAPGGYFLFTVPVTNFAAHMGRYFGRKESDRINRSWYHRHLHDAAWWTDLLQRKGFEVKRIHSYQPDWFTLAYFALSTRPFRLFYRCGLNGNERFRRAVARMVSESITGTNEGGNILVVAQRPG